jgi:D-alanyl-D-alanine carboxypeptidase
MRVFPILATILTVGTARVATPAEAAEIRLTDPSVQAVLERAVARVRTEYGGKTPVPGVLVGVWDGKDGEWVQEIGMVDLNAGRPMTRADHFRIGSNTKTFVISVLLQLVDEGKLRLDDPVSSFDVGVTIPNGEHITVRELCQMRSGLFEVYDVPELNAATVKPDSTFDPRTLISWAVQQKPYFPPNAGYHYSNTNYRILGLIIEALTKDTVAHQIQQRLLVPFQLTQTSYPETEAMPAPWAHGYELDDRGEWRDVSNTIPVSLMGAAGEMVSDLDDMVRWVRLWVEGKTNGPETQRARLECLPIGAGEVGFGLGVGCASGWYGYTGGLPGYNTANYYFPATGAFVAAWVTLQKDDPKPGAANALFTELARVMTPDSPPILTAPSRPEAKTP